jgi:hypothetical protein
VRSALDIDEDEFIWNGYECALHDIVESPKKAYDELLRKAKELRVSVELALLKVRINGREVLITHKHGLWNEIKG